MALIGTVRFNGTGVFRHARVAAGSRVADAVRESREALFGHGDDIEDRHICAAFAAVPHAQMTVIVFVAGRELTQTQIDSRTGVFDAKREEPGVQL